MYVLSLRASNVPHVCAMFFYLVCMVASCNKEEKKNFFAGTKIIALKFAKKRELSTCGREHKTRSYI